MASTNSIPPEEERDSPSLSHQINACIASNHTTLNRLILDRLPRAVPPHTDNPSTYLTGLLHIGAVYIAFESLWQNLIGIHSEIAPIPYTFPFHSSSSPDHHHNDNNDTITTPPPLPRTRRVLEQVYTPTLLRAPRIKADIQAMTGWPDHIFQQQLLLAAATTTTHLGSFTHHIHATVAAKPHVLLAYAYTLYLALLSGGTYIRAELRALEPTGFWDAVPAPVLPGRVACWPEGRQQRQQRDSNDDEDEGEEEERRRLPLDFLDFDHDPCLSAAHRKQQTKRLKADFKARFAVADALLTEAERRDVVMEAGGIFRRLEGVVAQLDLLFANEGEEEDAATTTTVPAAVVVGKTLGGRLRDSIALAKGRWLFRARPRSRGSSTAAVAAVAQQGRSARGEGEEVDARAEGQAAREYYDGDDDDDNDQLGRNAVVPREGFRPIRYDDGEGPRLHSRAAAATAAHRGDDDEGAKGVGKNSNVRHRGFDGASDFTCCPMSRREPAVVPVQKSGDGARGYAVYALVSNFVVWGGVVGMFLAWWWVRCEEEGGLRRYGVGM